jgi:inositol oxygenase
VVGDTFPVGCAWSEKIVFHPFFSDNPDSQNGRYQSRLGVYEEGKGLDSVCMSWGHDEYLYHVVKDYMPTEALYMIRYHSFYPAHRDGEYGYLMNQQDREMFRWVQAFNPYDLYTKSHKKPDLKELRPFYDDLISEYLPATLRW